MKQYQTRIMIRFPTKKGKVVLFMLYTFLKRTTPKPTQRTRDLIAENATAYTPSITIKM